MLGAAPNRAAAQYLGQYLPSAVPGYSQEPGVTVESRLRNSYVPGGLRVGSFILHPELEEASGFNSNVSGFGNAPGSWLLRTAPSVSVNSDWSRDRVGAAFALNDTRFLSAPQQDFTDWTASVGGGLTLGHEDLVLGYSHLSLHEDPAQIGSILSSTPIPYQVDDLRSSYVFDQGRISIIPKVGVQRYSFGDATLLGVPQSQQSQNRVVASAEVETRLALSDMHKLVFIVEGLDARYTDTPRGQPTNNATSLLALGGIDYQASGPWRYRLLLGVETRSYEAPQFADHTAPIAEASVIWTRTGMTTLTGTLSRTIEEPAAAGTGGYTLTRARLVVDHEYLRNVLLQTHVGFESAEYLQAGGTQSDVTAGAGVHWFLNRGTRLALDYSFTHQNGSNVNNIGASTGALGTGNFNRNVLLLTVRFGL